VRKSLFSIAIGLAILSSPLAALAQQQQPAPGYSFPDDQQPANMQQRPDDQYQQPGQPPIPQYVPPGQQTAPQYDPSQYAPPAQTNPALPQYQTNQQYAPGQQYQPGQAYPAQQYPQQYQVQQPQTGQQYYDPRYDPNAAPQAYPNGQVAPTGAAAYSDQDPGVRALRQLRKIRRDLQQAGPDPTGHRAQAQQYLDQAIQELRATMPPGPQQ
jgi:hypothetical protein